MIILQGNERTLIMSNATQVFSDDYVYFLASGNLSFSVSEQLKVVLPWAPNRDSLDLPIFSCVLLYQVVVFEGSWSCFREEKLAAGQIDEIMEQVTKDQEITVKIYNVLWYILKQQLHKWKSKVTHLRMNCFHDAYKFSLCTCWSQTSSQIFL